MLMFFITKFYQRNCGICFQNMIVTYFVIYEQNSFWLYFFYFFYVLEILNKIKQKLKKIQFAYLLSIKISP